MTSKEYTTRHSIDSGATIYQALRRINELSGEQMVLFVVDREGKCLGSLTDGDIRRALISVADLYASVDEIMNKNFSYFRTFDFAEVVKARELRRRNIGIVPCLDDNNRILRLVNLKTTRCVLPVDAVLMAGGKGERLRPLTLNTPKPLLRVGKKAIIDYNIDQLAACGIENINVTVNYLHKQIEEHFEEPREDNVRVRCVKEPKFLGTIGSLKFVKELKNDIVLVMNSDLFTNIDYEDFFLHFYSHDADMSVAAVPYSVAVPYGILDLEGRNLKGMIEKPTYNYYANGGIYLMKKSLIKEIPDDEFFDATDLIDKLISQGRKVIRYPIKGFWIDIGSPQEYQKAQDMASRL